MGWKDCLNKEEEEKTETDFGGIEKEMELIFFLSRRRKKKFLEVKRKIIRKCEEKKTFYH